MLRLEHRLFRTYFQILPEKDVKTSKVQTQHHLIYKDPLVFLISTKLQFGTII